MTSPRDVVLLIGQLTHGGAERQVVELAGGLRTTAFSPRVVCLSRNADPYGAVLESVGIDVTLFTRSSHWDLHRVLALRRDLRRRPPAVVHAFLEVANDYGYLATRGLGIPLIASLRNCAWSPNGLRRRADRWVLARAEATLVNAEAGAQFLHDAGVHPRRLEVIPNGVDVARFEDTVDRTALRRELQLPLDAPLVGAVGLLKTQKRPDVFLAVADAIRQSRPDVHCLWAGGGAELEYWKSCSRTFPHLREGMHWLGPRTDVPAILRSLDVYLMVSDFEGLPNAVMEAMAAGCPVVTTRAGGVGELIRHEETGLMAEPGDARALAAAVRRALESPDQAREWAAAAARLIREEYSAPRMVERTVRLYESLLH